MLLHFNFLVIETFARIEGVSAFMEAMNDGIPSAAQKEQEALEGEGLEQAEYFAEKDILDRTFHIWIPTFASYSMTILLHSIVETQLDAFAEYVRQRSAVSLKVDDLAGKGVGRCADYLKKVLSIDVKTDVAWSSLKDLHALRNIIVHRGGKPGNAAQKKEVTAFVNRYPLSLGLKQPDGFHDQLWISMNLCRDFARSVEGFFERVFKAAGLPDRHGHLDQGT